MCAPNHTHPLVTKPLVEDDQEGPWLTLVTLLGGYREITQSGNPETPHLPRWVGAQPPPLWNYGARRAGMAQFKLDVLAQDQAPEFLPC